MMYLQESILFQVKITNWLLDMEAIVIGQLHADKCDYHAIYRQPSYLLVDNSAHAC